MSMIPYYVTLTWDDWPEGGSYGTVVPVPMDPPEGAGLAEWQEGDWSRYATAMAKQKMAESRATEDPDHDADYYLKTYSDQWHIVDCVPVTDMIVSLARYLGEELVVNCAPLTDVIVSVARYLGEAL